MRCDNEEILRKKQLVFELQTKYPEIRLSSEAISRCQADEVLRLVQVLMHNERLNRATRQIQSYFRMRIVRKQFLI